jgi:hypothetical protein
MPQEIGMESNVVTRHYQKQTYKMVTKQPFVIGQYFVN